MVKNNKIFKIRLDGGRLCLDYINTVNDRFARNYVDYLKTVDDLIDWALHLQIIDTNQHKFLRNYGKTHQSIINEIYNEAYALRELLYRIFSKISRNDDVQAQDMVEFNRRLPYYLSKLQLEKSKEGFNEVWNFEKNDLRILIAPIIMDAYSLLLDSRHDRIKECPNCGWLFFDKSKNGRRRWCSMQTCGSNVKALEWYRRQKKNIL